MKYIMSAVGLAGVLAVAGVAIAQQPVQTVNPNRHPNIAAAQRFCADAYQKIVIAQQDNHYDMAGHGDKAKALLYQASVELQLAADAANRH